MHINKNKLRIYSLLCIFFFIKNSCYSQTIDGDTLQTFEVKEQAFDLNIGKKTLIDSTTQQLFLHNNLGQLLTQNSPIHIKNYGAGGSTTVSFRGTGASHTQLLWEGVPINSAVHGTADLSLLPVAFFENISVHYGTESLQNQSGALGGSIQLKDDIGWDKQLIVKVSQSFNSLKNYDAFFQLAAGNSKWQSVSNWSMKLHKNQFADVFPQKKNSQHLLQELYWKNVPSQTISAKIWYQTTQSNLTEREQQTDQSLRFFLAWEKEQRKGNFSAKIAYTDDFLRYQNSLLGIDDSTSLQQYFAEFSNHLLFLKDKIKWTNQLNFIVTKASVTNYEEAHYQEKIAFASSIHLNFLSNLKAQLLLRQEWVDGKNTPFLPALYLSYRPLQINWLQLKASSAKNYHVPTFNDRFWPQVGNPNLIPEHGWTHELSILFEPAFKQKKWALTTEITAYSSQFEDWIQWLPNASSLWEPQNLRLVNGKGIEAQLTTVAYFSDVQFKLSANYAFTKSTNQKSIRVGDNSEGKQLVFVPFHTATSSLYVSKKGYFISYFQNFTSKRYKTSNNDPFATLNAYTLAELHLGKSFSAQKFTSSLRLSVYNLWNTTYQTITAYQMPQRHFGISILLTAKAPKK